MVKFHWFFMDSLNRSKFGKLRRKYINSTKWEKSGVIGIRFEWLILKLGKIIWEYRIIIIIIIVGIIRVGKFGKSNRKWKKYWRIGFRFGRPMGKPGKRWRK